VLLYPMDLKHGCNFSISSILCPNGVRAGGILKRTATGMTRFIPSVTASSRRSRKQGTGELAVPLSKRRYISRANWSTGAGWNNSQPRLRGRFQRLFFGKNQVLRVRLSKDPVRVRRGGFPGGGRFFFIICSARSAFAKLKQQIRTYATAFGTRDSQIVRNL
jgi:hypothetical protein